ncbi:STAS domain-containing protein [Kribbella deserti]|uniref:STAS domain-containing protein n=1 Tax=Kribbella deserti TaxID=1926257 RepID=A0ABV6QF99_9ACTN
MPDSIHSSSPQKAIISLSDGLLADGLSALRQSIRDLVMSGVAVVVIDVSDARQIDSTLLGVLLDTHRICRQRGGGVVVRHADRRTADLLHRTGLDRVFDVADES